MLVLEREKVIMELLEQRGSVRVGELAGLFGVTEETVRRDLDRLEEKGVLRRSHGGAVPAQGRENETPYWFREVTQEKEKAIIAREALNHIAEGDRIILDASTTAWHIAKRLRNMELTVVTNSIRVAVALSEFDKVKVIAIGGQLARRSLSFVGPAAEESVRNYHVDKLFLSCAGVDLEHGLSDSTDEQASMRRCMMKQADRRYLLVDHCKFGLKSLAVIGGINLVDEIITDEETSRDLIDQIAGVGVLVSVVQDKNESLSKEKP